MTKVKTILAEFCSPKDILAINRLGLLKKDERESQPIPWRHRLNNRERRELVRSELRMSVRPPSHHGKKEHLRAINSAKCPKDSRMGECLISGHSQSSSLLAPRLGKLSSEQHRTECLLQHNKKTFLRKSTCLNHEPLILVERPATPKVKSRASFMKKHGVDPMIVEMPRYMRPTQSRSRTPSTLTTIEAFTVDAKKKKNLWEEAVEDKDDLKFKSMSKSSARLTDAEVKMLKVGHSLHKPTQESICKDVTEEDEEVETSPPPRCVSGRKAKTTGAALSQKPDPIKRPETVAEGSIFITQLPGKELASNKGGNKLKSVTFSDLGTTKKARGGIAAKEPLSSVNSGRALMRRSGRQEPSDTFQELYSSKKSPPDIAPSRSLKGKKSTSKPFLRLVLQH